MGRLCILLERDTSHAVGEDSDRREKQTLSDGLQQYGEDATCAFPHDALPLASHPAVAHSWGLAYNLLGEKLTGIDIFPRSVYDTGA